MTERKDREPTQYDVWKDIIKKAKKEHIVLIAYFFELTIVVVASIVSIQNLNNVSLFYGVVFSIGFLGAIFIPRLLIWRLMSLKGGL